MWDTSHSQILLPPFCAAPPSFFFFLWADQASHTLSHPFFWFQFPVASAFLPKPLTCTPFSGALITLSIACKNTDVFPPLAFFFFLVYPIFLGALSFFLLFQSQKSKENSPKGVKRGKRGSMVLGWGSVSSFY